MLNWRGLLILMLLSVQPFMARAAIPQPVEIVLQGGQPVWLAALPEEQIISLALDFDGGARLDDVEGLGALTADLLREGAGPLPARDFKIRLAAQAVELRIWLSRDALHIRLTCLKRARAEAFALLRLALTAPRFDGEAIERAKARVIQQLAAQAQNPDQLAWRYWRELAFGGHIYARPVRGTLASVEGFARAQFKAQHKKLLSGRLFITAAGAIDAAGLAQELNPLLAALPQQHQPALGAPLQLAAGALQHREREQEQTVIFFGAAALKRGDPDFIPAYVMMHILGRGSSSLLMESLRRESGLVYAVSAQLAPWRLGGIMTGSASTHPAQAGEALARIRRVFAKADRIGETELAAAKAYLTGSYALRFDSIASLTGQFAAQQRAGLGIGYAQQRNALIEAVSLADISRIAAQLDLANRLTVFTLGPKDL